MFGAVTNQAGWAQVVEKSYAILAAAANPQTGLVPDWCTAMKDGYTLSGSATGTVFGQMAFTAPMSVAATVDPKFSTFAAQAQVSLSSKSLSQDKGTYSYFNASWGLIGMLTLSGNCANLRRFQAKISDER